jgi:hypothetical protein
VGGRKKERRITSIVPPNRPSAGFRRFVDVISGWCTAIGEERQQMARRISCRQKKGRGRKEMGRRKREEGEWEGDKTKTHIVLYRR